MSNTNPFVVKVEHAKSLRRFLVEHPCQEASFETLKASIKRAFPELHPVHDFQLVFVDNEGDSCILSSDQELAEAVNCAVREEGKSLRLRVQELPSSSPVAAFAEIQEPQPAVQQPTPQADEPAGLDAKIESKSEEDQIEDENVIPVYLTLLMDFLETPTIVTKIPALVEKAVSLLPSVRDEASALALVQSLLNEFPTIRDHQFTQMGLPKVLPKVATKLPRVAMSPMAALAPAMLPTLLAQLPSLLSALPTVLASVLADLTQDAAADAQLLKARVFGQLQPLLLAFGPQAALLGGLFNQMPCAQPAAAAHAQDAPLDSKSVSDVHDGIFCDHCKIKPIQGPRFHCTVCPDFDLCGACEEKCVHPAEHPMVKTRVVPRKDIHHNVMCDDCGVSPIEGNRFKCQVCPNFDLCGTCEAKNQHPEDHALLKLRVSQQQQGPRHGFRGGHGGRRGCPFKTGPRRGGHGLGKFFRALSQQVGQQVSNVAHQVDERVALQAWAEQMTQAAQQADQVIAAHVAAATTPVTDTRVTKKEAKATKKGAKVAAKATKKEAKVAAKALKKQEKALKKQVKEANKKSKRNSPSTTLCAREECSFLTHSNGRIGFGSHCCRACKLKGRHGPACERVRAVPQPVEEEQPKVTPAALSLSNPEVLAVAEVFCPADHKLVQFQTTHGKFYCDDCKAKVKQGTTLFGCRKCDYDLCEVCVAQAVSSRVPTPALTPQVSVEEEVATPEPEEKVKEPVEEKVKEPVEEKVKEPVEEKVKEPVEEKVKEPVEEKVKEPDKHESEPEDAMVEPAAKAQDPDVAKFASQLAALRNMGFEETNLNLYLLKRNKGVVSKVVNWYLDNAQV
jgi:hypothetical protein